MDFMILFLAMYLVISVVLVILFLIFKTYINEKLYFLLPFIFATIICFPAFLVLLGYWLCLNDIRRTQKKKNRAVEFEYKTRKYTPNYERGKLGK